MRDYTEKSLYFVIFVSLAAPAKCRCSRTLLNGNSAVISRSVRQSAGIVRKSRQVHPGPDKSILRSIRTLVIYRTSSECILVRDRHVDHRRGARGDFAV